MQIFQRSYTHRYTHTRSLIGMHIEELALRQKTARRCQRRQRQRQRRDADVNCRQHTKAATATQAHTRTQRSLSHSLACISLVCSSFVMNLNYTWRACKCFRQHIGWWLALLHWFCVRAHKEAVHEFSTLATSRQCATVAVCVRVSAYVSSLVQWVSMLSVVVAAADCRLNGGRMDWKARLLNEREPLAHGAGAATTIAIAKVKIMRVVFCWQPWFPFAFYLDMKIFNFTN